MAQSVGSSAPGLTRAVSHRFEPRSPTTFYHYHLPCTVRDHSVFCLLVLHRDQCSMETGRIR